MAKWMMLCSDVPNDFWYSLLVDSQLVGDNNVTVGCDYPTFIDNVDYAIVGWCFFFDDIFIGSPYKHVYVSFSHCHDYVCEDEDVLKIIYE